MINARNYWVLCLFVVGCWLATIGVQAAPLQHITDARVIYDSNESVLDYPLALSTPKKLKGIWQIERVEKLAGKLSRQTIELPKNSSSVDVFNDYEQQLSLQSSRLLFECHGRKCGPSNGWANVHFQIKQLYGLDQFQHFAAYEVVIDDVVSYISVYVVRRGNKRVFAQVDQLETTSQVPGQVTASSDTLMTLLERHGYFVLPGVSLENSKNINVETGHLNSVIDMLKQYPFKRIVVVGHIDLKRLSSSKSLERSLHYAQQVKALLIESGGDESRIDAFGAGHYVPVRKSTLAPRIEIVLQR